LSIEIKMRLPCSRLWKLKKPFIFGPVGGGQIAPKELKEFYLDQWFAEQQRSFIVQYLTQFNPIVRQTIKNADFLLFENKETYELCHRIGKPKRVGFALSSGLPSEYLPVEPPTRSISTTLKLLWVARLHPRKGLRLTLQALAEVNPDVNFKMTILGDGISKPYIPSWLKEFQLEKKVEYRGQLSWEEVKQEYLCSDVFLFSSLRDTFGAQLWEAMAHALPLIVLDHHGARDFITEDMGIKIPVTEPTYTVRAIARAIEYLYEHPQKRIEMGRNGYEFAKRNTWEEKAKMMCSYYKELMLSQKQMA